MADRLGGGGACRKASIIIGEPCTVVLSRSDEVVSEDERREKGTLAALDETITSTRQRTESRQWNSDMMLLGRDVCQDEMECVRRCIVATTVRTCRVKEEQQQQRIGDLLQWMYDVWQSLAEWQSGRYIQATEGLQPAGLCTFRFDAKPPERSLSHVPPSSLAPLLLAPVTPKQAYTAYPLFLRSRLLSSPTSSLCACLLPLASDCLMYPTYPALPAAIQPALHRTRPLAGAQQRCPTSCS